MAMMMNMTMTEMFMTTEYIATTAYTSTMMGTDDEFTTYDDISKNAGTEIILALISVSVACMVLFLYIKDLIASGVCKKGFRHYDDEINLQLQESIRVQSDSVAQPK